MRIAIGLCVVALLSPAAGRAQAVAPQDAVQYVGQTATVCGVVASARYSARTKTRPTFLNLGQPYPRQVFTVVIFGDERPKFGEPEVTFAGKRVCATGRIELYRGKPEMILNDPATLRPDTGQTGRTARPPSTLRPALTE
jgi:hypothetical protein